MALYSFQGVTITFSSTYFTNVTSVRWGGISRAPIPTSKSSTTGAMSFIPSNLYDPGELTVEGYNDNTKSFVTPITGAAETVTVTKLASGQNTGGTCAASGFLTSWEWGGPSDESPQAATYTATIKFTDDITFTAGS
jgi:hypothetical protein